ncbi:hypothetical protein BC829DRAFT_394618 [Chytridium lagenaria]|nr:hypothetical protein BC829DRAFT_394618 [Chytridium lagenaria]
MKLLTWFTVTAALTVTTMAFPTTECGAFTDLSGSSAITYTSEAVWVDGRRAWCYPFSDRPQSKAGPASRNRIRANPIVFLEYPTGESAGDPIVTSTPCQETYSDAWLRFTVVVDVKTPFNYYREYGQIESADVDLKRSGFFNFPLVTPGSKLVDWSNNTLPTPETFSAWFNGQRVYLFDFGPIPQNNNLDFVQASEAVAIFQKDDFEVPVQNGFTIIDKIPGSEGYTGFFDYKSYTTTSSPYNLYRSISAVTPTIDRDLILNCPVVAVDDVVYEGNPPLPPVSSTRSPVEPIPEPGAPEARVEDTCEATYLNAESEGVKYLSAEGWAAKKKFGCWNLGLRTPIVNGTRAKVSTVYQPVYADTGLRAGLPVFITLPCSEGYSDAVEVISFLVPKTVPFNFFKDAEALLSSTANTVSTGFFNYPVVQPGSTLTINPSDNAPPAAYLNQPVLSEAWFKGQILFYINFGSIPSRARGASSLSTGNAVFPYRQNGLGDDVLFGNPIFSSVAGDPAYTGFYSVAKAPATTANEFTDYLDFDLGKVSELGSVLNCPTAYYA